MPAERLSMRRVREILRLRAQGHSIRQVARSLTLPPTTVRDHLARAEAAGVSWPLPDEFDDQRLEDRLFFKPQEPSSRPVPDWPYVHAELRRKGVTLYLLWDEYKTQHPDDGYQYTQFCEHYHR